MRFGPWHPNHWFNYTTRRFLRNRGFQADPQSDSDRRLVYFSRSIDHVGIFSQDMAGMALAASALCQAWRPLSPPNALPALGIPVGPYLEQTEPHALDAFENQISRLEAIG